MPPFGNLYGIPTFVDSSLIKEPELVFQAGSHTETIALQPSDNLQQAVQRSHHLFTRRPWRSTRVGFLSNCPSDQRVSSQTEPQAYCAQGRS